MEQKQLDRILAEADRANGVLFKLRTGNFGEQDLEALRQICNCISQVVSTTLLIEKKWVNRVMNLPLELEMLANDSAEFLANEASEAAVERLREVAVFYDFPLTESDESSSANSQTEIIGTMLASDEGYLFGIRMKRLVEDEKARALISLLYGLNVTASSDVVERELLAQLVPIPYELYWNRRYFEGENLKRYDVLSREINEALNYVLK